MNIKIIEKQEKSLTIDIPSYWTNGLHYFAILSEKQMITAVSYPGYERIAKEAVRLGADSKEITRGEFLTVYGDALKVIGDSLNDTVIHKEAA